MIDPIILGHNQFIGVDHLSQDKARDRVERFSDIRKIHDMIKFSHDIGVTGIMLSTHPKVKAIIKAISEDQELSKNLNIYPLVPYAQGYVTKANEKGIIAMVMDALETANTKTKFKMILKGGISVVRQDIMSVLSTLIDVELLPFKDLNVKAVFLHNILTDMALSLRAKDLFEFFIDYIDSHYKAIPAFATMNFVKLTRTFEEWGIEQPLIMASFNKVGFQMNPSREECEQRLQKGGVNVLAMSTLAAGYLKPREAYEYLFSLPNINSVVVGASTPAHLEETVGIIQEFRGSVSSSPLERGGKRTCLTTVDMLKKEVIQS